MCWWWQVACLLFTCSPRYHFTYLEWFAAFDKRVTCRQSPVEKRDGEHVKRGTHDDVILQVMRKRKKEGGEEEEEEEEAAAADVTVVE